VDAWVSTGIHPTYTTRKRPRGVRLSTPSVFSLKSLMSLEVVRVLPFASILMSPVTLRLQGVLPRRLVLSLRQTLVVLWVLRVCGTWLDWRLRFSWSLLRQRQPLPLLQSRPLVGVAPGEAHRLRAPGDPAVLTHRTVTVGAVDATLSVVPTRPMEPSVIMRIRLERLLMARMGVGVRVDGSLGVGVGLVRVERA